VQNEPNLGQSGWRPGANCAKQSRAWARWDTWGVAYQGGGDGAKRTQFRRVRPRAAGQLRKTKPICLGVVLVLRRNRWGKPHPTWKASGGTPDHEEPIMQNEPNLAEPAGETPSSFHYSIIPIFQSCKTKPIWAGVSSLKCKVSSEDGSGKRAKQTQFGTWCPEMDAGRPAGDLRRRPIVQNEANFPA
jgi:hypothetical protein